MHIPVRKEKPSDKHSAIKQLGAASVRRPLTLILSLALILASVFVLTRDATTCAHSLNGVTILHMTEAGFEPRSLDITTVQAVSFENAGSVDVWPASDSHPTHEKLPALDPKQALRPGENWNFSFDTPGTFYVHDHLRPDNKGIIVVSGDAAAITGTERAAPAACAEK